MSNTHDTLEEEAPRRTVQAKRRPRKRRKFILAPWGRGLIALAAVIVTVGFTVQTALRLARPYELGARQAAVLAQATEQRDDLTAQNADLVRQCAYLNRPDGIESAARTLGYLRPGEISLVIVPPAPKAAPVPGR